MKKQYIYIFMVCLSAVFSCVRVDESLIGEGEAEVVEMSIEATIEKSVDTRTALEGSLADEKMRTVWVPSDSIGVMAWRSGMGQNETVAKFTTDITENTETASFEGVTSASKKYYAFYPYHTGLRGSSESFVFTLTAQQNYAEGSFDPKAAPMVAKAGYGESFDFQNLCGLLALQLTGAEAVKAITFLGKDEAGNSIPVSGTFSVPMDYETAPEIVPGDPDANPMAQSSMTQSSVTLTCETPVQLSETAVPFYFVLPAATYSSFMVMIYTDEGKVMAKEATKPLTITRSHVKPTAALQYAENVYIDLSEEGWSNSYIVNEPGMYSFDATVIGNGEFGIVQNSGFHTTDPHISPVKAELLWTDRDNVVSAPVLVNGQVSFYAMGTEGNALIAVKDDGGNILWSWHIWVTDQPMDQVYKNNYGTFTVMDRNLGAVRNDRGSTDSDWIDAMGVLYQWGRKDPFTGTFENSNLISQLYSVNSSKASIATTVANPTVYIGGNNTTWVEPDNTMMWSRSQKTIYDPCPHGYRVISREAWYGFTKDGNNHYDEPDYYNISGDYDKGWLFKYDGDKTTYYPANNYIERNGNYQWNRHYYGDMWSSTASSSTYAYRFRFYYDDGNSNIEVYGTDRLTYAFPVRCMLDEGAVNAVVSLSDFSDLTSSSVSVTASVSVDGHMDVSRRGLLYSTSAHPDLENTTPIECGAGVGDFTEEITGLSASTKYYVRAFAVVGSEVIYSNESSFITPDANGVVNLSSAGTANSYVITNEGTYIFDATVKGNSNETIGTPTTVEVVWETLNISDSVTEGAVISSLSLEDGFVKFSTPDNFTEGNALIAVRDVTESIIWSWHIWAVKFDPEGDAQIYQSGAMMMDRNLGALNTIPGDVRSFGLLYQWGRKDPFVGSGDAKSSSVKAATYPAEAIQYVQYSDRVNNIDYAILNPNHFIQSSSWNNDSRYWGEYKTKYDPCPPGWRVPDSNSEVWNGFSEVSYINNGSFFEAPMSTPTAYYPYTGRLYSQGSLDGVNGNTYPWIAGNSGHSFGTGNSWINTNEWRGYSDGNPVRCMKDADFTLVTAEAETIAGTYAVVGGEITVNDATHIDFMGVVYSPISSEPKLATAYVENVSDIEDGAFKVTLSDLKPNTTYWYRIYAQGGYNTRYGDIRSFTTKSAADNEGYGSENDFEW